MPSGIANTSATAIAASASCTVRYSRRPDLAGDRRSVAERRAEIAAYRATDERDVLREQRPIEAEGMPQRRHFFSGGGFAEHRLRRVARHEMNEREDKRRDAEEHRDREHQAANEVREHASGDQRSDVSAHGVILPPIAPRPSNDSRRPPSIPASSTSSPVPDARRQALVRRATADRPPGRVRRARTGARTPPALPRMTRARSRPPAPLDVAGCRA